MEVSEMKYDAFVDACGPLADELAFLARAIGKDEILARAIGKEETRYVMMNMYVEPLENGEDLCGVATDGRHLHIVSPLHKSADVFGLKAGHWKVLKNTQNALWMVRLNDETTKGRELPNYKNIIPTGEALHKTIFKGFAFSGRHANYTGLAEFIHDFPDATALNLKYLADLGTESEWAVEWYGARRNLIFTCNNRMAVIAPMQIVQEETT